MLIAKRETKMRYSSCYNVMCYGYDNVYLAAK